MTQHCPSCGSELAPDAKFCNRCGQAVAATPPEEGPSPQAPSGERRRRGAGAAWTGALVVSVILAVSVIGVGAWLALAGSGEEEERTPTARTGTPSGAVYATGTPRATASPRAPASPTPTGTASPDACVPQAPPQGQANLFHNPGFEFGGEPWCSLYPEKVLPFEVNQTFAHSGQSSALLRMRVPAEEKGDAKVFYLLQEVVPEQFPEVISGYYRVENWTKGTPNQYLQLVVIAFGATNLPGGYPNHQVRYPLAGISEEPFAIANARFVFIGKEEPRIGTWVYFERNIEEDFEELWGVAPRGFSKIRVIFEVRYDNKEAGLTPANADVYYDDLYMGPASENPNRAAGLASES